MERDENNLFRHTATVENGAAFRATREGDLARICPLTPRAIAWLRQHVPDNDDSTRLGDDIVVEMRYFALLADAIMANGFLFERHALPN